MSSSKLYEHVTTLVSVLDFIHTITQIFRDVAMTGTTSFFISADLMVCAINN